MDNEGTVRWWSEMPAEGRQVLIHELLRDPTDQRIAGMVSLFRAPVGYGIYASAGPNYHYAIFGRDSLEVAADLLHVMPQLSKEIIFCVARWQGRQLNPATEEESGKIHHEYRARQFGEITISPAAQKVFDRLSPVWGGEDGTLCYYGTVDATLLFVRVIGEYVALYGAAILDEKITDRYGYELSLRDHLREAAEWIKRKVETSSWHLIEYKRLNAKGLPNQAWKDSDTSYLHTDGMTANADGGIASIEVQGYGYDALMTASRLVALDSSDSQHYRELADQLRASALNQLWMPAGEQSFFAMGLDRDGTGAPRQIKTLTSNAAAVLDSGLLLELGPEVRSRFVEPIVRMIMSAEFFTEVGIRTRAVRHASLLNYADYHGSLVSWPKETYDIAKGLRRHGYYSQATELEDCLLRAVAHSGEFYEFYYVNESGSVKYHYRNEHPDEPQFHEFGAANLPEPGQAWTVSAILAIAYGRRRRER